MVKVKMIHETSDLQQFPQLVYVIQWDEEDFVKEEPREINSIADLNALLEEVKQYNDDPYNKEGSCYKTIITR